MQDGHPLPEKEPFVFPLIWVVNCGNTCNRSAPHSSVLCSLLAEGTENPASHTGDRRRATSWERRGSEAGFVPPGFLGHLWSRDTWAGAWDPLPGRPCSRVLRVPRARLCLPPLGGPSAPNVTLSHSQLSWADLPLPALGCGATGGEVSGQGDFAPCKEECLSHIVGGGWRRVEGEGQ